MRTARIVSSVWSREKPRVFAAVFCTYRYPYPSFIRLPYFVLSFIVVSDRLIRASVWAYTEHTDAYDDCLNRLYNSKHCGAFESPRVSTICSSEHQTLRILFRSSMYAPIAKDTIGRTLQTGRVKLSPLAATLSLKRAAVKFSGATPSSTLVNPFLSSDNPGAHMSCGPPAIRTPPSPQHIVELR